MDGGWARMHLRLTAAVDDTPFVPLKLELVEAVEVCGPFSAQYGSRLGASREECVLFNTFF